MAKIVPLQNQFERMVRDVARNRLPRNACWDLLDWIPSEIDAPLAKRGGWAYASENLAGVMANADRVASLTYAEYSAGAQLIAVVRDDGAANTQRLMAIISPASTTNVGVTRLPAENLTFYRDKVYITDNAGVNDPHFYSGSGAIQTVVTSPPTGSRSAVYKDRLLLARSSANLNRIWFSAGGDPTTWDTTNRYIDASDEIKGLYALRNAILIFHTNSLERIIGSIPPPGSDMFLQPVWPAGCDHPFSLAGSDQFCCFANAGGVYITDGAAVTDLTAEGGIKSYWQAQCASANQLAIAGGYYRGYYVATIRHGTVGGSLIDCLMVHIKSRRWMRLSNITGGCFGTRYSGKEELYWGDFSEARVNTFAGLFSPTGTIKADGDGTAVTPSVETPYYEFGQSKSTIRDIYISYDLREATDGDNPVLTLQYALDPQQTSYSIAVGQDGVSYTLPETTVMTRSRRHIRKSTYGIGLKIIQTNASAQSRIYSLAADAHPREDSRV